MSTTPSTPREPNDELAELVRVFGLSPSEVVQLRNLPEGYFSQPLADDALNDAAKLFNLRPETVEQIRALPRGFYARELDRILSDSETDLSIRITDEESRLTDTSSASH